MMQEIYHGPYPAGEKKKEVLQQGPIQATAEKDQFDGVDPIARDTPSRKYRNLYTADYCIHMPCSP